MKKFTFKGIVSLLAILLISSTQSFSQTATITPANATILQGSSQSFTIATSGFGGGGNDRTFAYTITGPGATIPASPASFNCTSTCNNESHSFQFPTAGTYTVSVTVTQTEGGSAVASTSTTINVLAPNLWSSSGTNDVQKYAVDPVSGAILAGPTAVGTPSVSTAALAKNSITGTDPNGFLYYLQNTNYSNNGTVNLYCMNPATGANTSLGSFDINGAGNGAGLGFVRLGFSPDGYGYILAGDGSTVLYLARFLGNGSNPTTITSLGTVTVSGGSPGEFQNGDLAFSGNGTMYVIANVSDGTTYVYTKAPSSSVLNRRWTLVQPNNSNFTGSVNGIAFTVTGSIHVSTSAGLYFINQFTANTTSGTVQCALVQSATGLTDLASPFFPQQTTLPVELISFAGAYSNQKTNLNWVTENLQDFDRFEVERSTDGTNYITVATKAPVQTAARTTYLHTDDLSAVNGTVFYYRLKMIDLNGQFKYSNVILVRKESNIKGIRINPNPVVTNGTTTVRFEATAKGTVELRIVDMAGRQVLKQQNNVAEGINSVPVNNLGRLQPGTYILQMNDGTSIQSAKFVIAQ